MSPRDVLLVRCRRAPGGGIVVGCRFIVVLGFLCNKSHTTFLTRQDADSFVVDEASLRS